jgi:hypothetical protein
MRTIGVKLVPWLVLALSIGAACAPSLGQACGESVIQACDLADRYLRAVSGAAEDRGWSLLHPETRQAGFDDDYDRYLAEARATDWSGFAWRIEEAVADDPTLYFIGLRTDSARGFPDFLLRPRASNLTLLSPARDDYATMAIRFSLTGTGVWAAGG